MFVLPTIDQDDIQWVCKVLRLPPTAFTGVEGNDPRAEVLLSNETLDIEACPGSGKTTLLVAKLAILARKWNSRCSGICVLSHTNAARREIERCLGQAAEGIKILSYPHFVGTIHGFVNEFLAIPWIRSLGYPVTTIDDVLCEQHRRRLLALSCYGTLRGYVGSKEKYSGANYVGSWYVATPDFLAHNAKGEQLFKNLNVPSAKQISTLLKQCTEDGFYRYEELFMWADDLLSKYPEAVLSVRQRFPLLFIDEVQDNSEIQSKILQRIFTEGIEPVIRQRFGDTNQSIYASINEVGAQSDSFPEEGIRRDIPNSYRFGQDIANIANPLALQPQNLQGLGPPTHTITSETPAQHAVFLFNDDSICGVLNCYASYLLEIFSGDELKAGTFTAVGAVHRPGDNSNVPRFIGHYWQDYDHQLSYSEPRPNTFHQYIAAGWTKAHESGDVHAITEQVAEGVLRATRIVEPAVKLGRRKRKHRYILELLDHFQELKDNYLSLILRLINDEHEITTNEWQEHWTPIFLQLVQTLSDSEINPNLLDEFLAWPKESPEQDSTHKVNTRDNYYRYPEDNPAVSIRVGSIHSAKGETHTATLVLDTFFHDHHFHALKPWLCGEREGQGGEGVRMQTRLKQHYVAFTRPTHLLCIAMRDDLSTVEIHKIKSRAWRVGKVQIGGEIEWI